MLKITDDQRKWIQEHIENADALMEGELSPLLDAISDWQFENGFDKNDDITDAGRRAERVLDGIYYSN